METSERSKIGKASKKKGQRGEYELRDWIMKIAGGVWSRTPMSCGFHQSFPFDVYKKSKDETVFDDVGNENKNTSRLAVGDWIEQTELANLDYFGWNNPKWFIRFKHNHKIYFIISEKYFEFLVGEQKKLRQKDV